MSLINLAVLRTALLGLFVCCLPLSLQAGNKIIEDSDQRLVTEVSGEYLMGDADTFMDAKRLAIEDAKRTAVQLAGTFIESETIMQDFEITKDEVRTFAAAFVETQLLGKPARRLSQSGAMVVTVNIRAEVDKREMAHRLKAQRQDPQGFREKLRTIEAENRKLKFKLDELNQQLKASNTDAAQVKKAVAERDKVLDLMAQITREALSDSARIQTDLLSQIQQTNRQLLSETRTISHKLDNVKKETSDDPRKELANRGISWTVSSYEEAIAAGDVDAVALFLKGGMDPSTISPKSGLMMPHVAILTIYPPGVSEQLFSLMLAHGLDPSRPLRWTYWGSFERQEQQMPLLYAAVGQSELGVAKLLIAKGADVQESVDFAETIIKEQREKLEPIKKWMAECTPKSPRWYITPVYDIACNRPSGRSEYKKFTDERERIIALNLTRIERLQRL